MKTYKNHIEERLVAAKKEGRKLFIPFITAGYPDLKTTEQLIYLFDECGVDIVEIGIPFSDPLADGPVIQEASQRALKKGVTAAKVLNLVKKVRPRVKLGIILFGALNPFYAYGLRKFLKNARAAGVQRLGRYARRRHRPVSRPIR